MVFVGIDWADKEHEVCIIDQEGTELTRFRVPHTHQGFETLKEQVLQHAGTPEKAPCFLETSQGLLVQFLLENGFPVYPLNPKVVDYRRKPSGAKSDTIDARLLAEIGRSDFRRLRRLVPDSEQMRELKILCRDQDALLEQATRLKNQLTAALKEYYPVALELFSEPTLPVALAFLETYPTLEAARKAPLPELVAFLKAHRHPQAEAAARRIYELVHAPQLEASPCVTRAKSRYMLALISQLKPLREAIKEYDEEITRLFRSHPDSLIFASLPGAGKRLAPRLLAGWGEDRGRYDNAAAMQALAGTSPVLYQSGKYRFARCRRSCVKFLRRTLQLFAYQSVRLVSWARDYYVRKRAAGKTHHEALRALANIWVRIIFAMWLKRETYNEAVFLAAKAKHAPVNA